MCHAGEAGSRKFSACIEEAFLVVGEGAGVDSADVAAEPAGDILVELIGFLVFKLDDFAVPSFLLDLLADGDGVFTVAVGSFITASDGLDDADGFSILMTLSRNTGSHTNKIILWRVEDLNLNQHNFPQ